MNKTLNVYYTHCEIHPYKKGEFFPLEKSLSKWDQKTLKYGEWVPVGYFIEDETLYLPKGVSIDALESDFGLTPTVNIPKRKSQDMSDKYDVLYPPRSEVQAESVKFLTAGSYNQYCLNLETSGGKTYCAIASLAIIGKKTIVLVNRELLADHWKSEIMKFTNIPGEKIMRVTSDNIDDVIEYEREADVYIAMHQTIQAYVRANGWESLNTFMEMAGIGLKIFDECHEYIKSMFYIDAHTNIARTFYLTATVGRSNTNERAVLNTILARSVRYTNLSDVERKINYIAIKYKSEIPMKYITSCRTMKGFSPVKYIDVALEKDPQKYIMQALDYVMAESVSRNGQILIVVPKKSAVKYIYDVLNRVIVGKTVGTIYSDNTKEVNLRNQTCDVIVSTIKSCGTGFNPPNLQTLICMEPHSSEIVTHQLKGRLDRCKEDESYFYDILDEAFTDISRMGWKHMKYFKNVAISVDEKFLDDVAF